MDTRRIKSLMVLNGDTLATLSEVVGCTKETLSKKINEWEGSEFTQSEIKAVKNYYNLTPEEVDSIFFAK
ncbi:XRE family transcriptional regulator [Trichococcus flocculiformis]|uniref:XRE family transcriptional regulator n=1 Tax=Trichococcus flocculiformis TaxID=82803 RepID=UPI003DA2E82C